MITGYLHPQYVASLAEFGTPRQLPACGGWILERDIPGVPYRDAMGCYPLFVCEDWPRLCEDLLSLKGDLVSLALVTDPFGSQKIEQLRTIFDVCYKFKEHYVTDLTQPLEKSVRGGHRYNARKALKVVSIDRCDRPYEHLTEWITLYDHLISRHNISGLRVFSRESFLKLLWLPGLEMFIARQGDQIVGAQIWIVQKNVGYVHLTAMNSIGYDLSASYALRWAAMEFFADRLQWIDHGAGAGLSQTDNGLTMFKRGWATETRPVYFCGRVFDREKYDGLVNTCSNSDLLYFPAYRAGEFT